MMMNQHSLYLLFLCILTFQINKATHIGKGFDLEVSSESPDGPPYPVTASWFKDRFTHQEWNQTLTQFIKQGGDTVILRAPPLIKQTPQQLLNDPNFKWCKNNQSTTTHCWDQAKQDLKALGLTISAFLTYQYDEDYSDAIMFCPKTDKKITTKTHGDYYLIVLPTKSTAEKMKTNCDFPKGSDVVVLLTSFTGIDPHQILLETATDLKVSVYFGLPAAPADFDQQLMPAYFDWVNRVLVEHKSRYTNLSHHAKDLYNTITGYYSTDECSLPELSIQSHTQPLIYLPLYTQLGQLVKKVDKHFAISPHINLNRFQTNSTVQDHVGGFINLMRTGVIDVVAVHEGRGFGKGAYFWPLQLNQSVASSDPVLDKILHALNPQIPADVTFAQAFTASNQVLFQALKHAQETIQQNSQDFEFWLNLEAFEYLKDDPCLPVDPKSSGMGKKLNRATKSRLDLGLSVAGALVQKVSSFAWDSDYTCTTHQYNSSLGQDILADLSRPIVSNCFFHSPHNLSVVILGFNLEGETQAFTVEWKDTRGQNRSNHIYGYYFETDYGVQHNLIKSLEYTMLWDIGEMVIHLAPTGTIHVTAEDAAYDCYFDYDLPNVRKKSIRT